MDKATQPVTIRKDRCVITIYDVTYFLWQGVDVRGLWKLMFSAPWDNEGSITQIRDWLPTSISEAETLISLCRTELAEARRSGLAADSRLADVKLHRKELPRTTPAIKQAKAELAEAKQNARRVESNLKTAIADHERAIKLQELFKTMANKAKL